MRAKIWAREQYNELLIGLNELDLYNEEQIVQIIEHAYLEGVSDSIADLVPEWIPVSERLPEENDACLVALDVSVFGNKGKAVDMGYINKGVWHDAHSEAPFAEINPVTHWQELPQLPDSD